MKYESIIISFFICIRWIFELCIHPRALEIITKLLGPNIIILSATLMTKYPSSSGNQTKKEFVGWHQDLKYCGLENAEEQGGKVQMVTMWLAIDKVPYTIR